MPLSCFLGEVAGANCYILSGAWALKLVSAAGSFAGFCLQQNHRGDGAPRRVELRTNGL